MATEMRPVSKIPRDRPSAPGEQPPVKRRRVALACDSCRERKTKCDGTKPVCKSCQRRGHVPGQCVYALVLDSARLRSEQDYLTSLRQHRDVSPVSVDTDHRQGHSSFVGLDGAHTARPIDLPNISKEQRLDQPSETSSCSFKNGGGSKGSCYEQPLDQEASDRHLDTPGSPIVIGSQQTTGYTRSNDSHHRNDAPKTVHGAAGKYDLTADKPKSTVLPQTNPTAISNLVSAMGTSISDSDQPSARPEQFYGSSSVVHLLDQFRPLSSQQDGSRVSGLRIPARQLPSSPPHDNMDRHDSISVTMLHGRYSLPPRIVADVLLRSYFDHVHIFYPWVHTSSFYDVYERLWTGQTLAAKDLSVLPDIGIGGCKSSNNAFFGALNAMLALGCENANLTPNEKSTVSTIVHGRLEEFLQIDLLNSCDLCHVQTLILSALYLQCTNSPSRCWNVIGLAYRISLGLGLHMQSTVSGRSQIEVEMRYRIWHGCTQLDIMSCMTLGRPLSSSQYYRVPLPSAIDDQYLCVNGQNGHQPSDVPSQTHFTLENIKLSQILENILSECYVSKDVAPVAKQMAKFDSIITLNSEILKFERELPQFLRWDLTTELSPSNGHPILRRQANVLHARYLHLKVLLYRPTFSEYCAKQPQLLAASHSSAREITSLNPLFSESDLCSSFQAQCAVSCVEAVCELVRSLNLAQRQEATGAWWWSVFYVVTSAIILLVAEQQLTLTSRIGANELEGAWDSCTEIAIQMSKNHSAVGPYVDFLQKLRQRASARPRNTSQTHQPAFRTETASSAYRTQLQQPTPPILSNLRDDYTIDSTATSDRGKLRGSMRSSIQYESNPPLDLAEDIFSQEWRNDWESIMYPDYVVHDMDMVFSGQTALDLDQTIREE